ncbi:MAG TPA: hypothetical protein VMS17_18090 [Gemmataceae bacterium]|nr:hypothetical protein [Gemmataceae bacterium]
MMKRMAWTAAAVAMGAGAAALLSAARGQQTLQQGFEGRDPLWTAGAADAAYTETAHRLTDEFAHGGRRSEYIELQAESGNYIYYTYNIGKATLDDVLSVGLWVKANRPGVQLLCRVVLPQEHDPQNLAQPLTALIKADEYQITGRWQQLTLKQPMKRLREQLQLMRADLNRDVIGAGAYIDQLVLNVWNGKGATQVWIDDLEVSPVDAVKPPDPIAAAPTPGRPTADRRADVVQLEGKQLLVDGKPFFPLMIRHTGTPLKTLYDAGFNVIAMDESTPPGLLEEAVALGFKVMPSVAPPPLPDDAAGRVNGLLTANDNFNRRMGRFLDQGSLLSWDMGGSLSFDQFKAVAGSAQAFHRADPMRPIAVDVADGCLAYSRGVEPVMLGVHRWPLLTGMELTAYRDWLTQRRQLAQPGVFCWTWVQTHVPDWFLATAYDRDANGAYTEPLGPQAEQVRLMAYAAIGSGYRGLGFWSDRFLADSHTGRDRLLSLALLNQEIEMLEPILVEGREPTWIDTSRPEVKAAVIRTKTACLVLPMWIGGGSQYVPGQDAVPELSVSVPMIPPSWGAWQISPAQVRSLKTERVTGATRVSLHDFSLTAAVVFTGDLGGMVVQFQKEQRKTAPTAAQWAHDQAAEELAKAEKVNAELEQEGRRLPDGAKLLQKARDAVDESARLRADGKHEEAYETAQSALRSVRILMRAHWDLAVKPLDGLPTASPYAVSYYTLPKHWRFMEEIKDLRLGANALAGGDFETAPDQQMKDWFMQEAPSLDEVTAIARRVSDQPHEGKQCLMLQLAPKDKTLPPLALERSFVAVLSPAVHLAPGTPIAVSAWVRVPEAITASPDGVLFYDSAGGEPLAARFTVPTKWKKITLYRKVPASGVVNVTLALTGLGTVYFDDVRIEPLN